MKFRCLFFQLKIDRQNVIYCLIILDDLKVLMLFTI